MRLQPCRLRENTDRIVSYRDALLSQPSESLLKSKDSARVRPAHVNSQPGARSACKAPLHRHDATGIAAGGDDAEIGARLFERARSLLQHRLPQCLGFDRLVW